MLRTLQHTHTAQFPCLLAALQYRWVFLKDAATESPPSDLSTLTSAHIPFTAEPSMGGIDPLACNPAGNFPVQSKVRFRAKAHAHCPRLPMSPTTG